MDTSVAGWRFWRRRGSDDTCHWPGGADRGNLNRGARPRTLAPSRAAATPSCCPGRRKNGGGSSEEPAEPDRRLETTPGLAVSFYSPSLVTLVRRGAYSHAGSLEANPGRWRWITVKDLVQPPVEGMLRRPERFCLHQRTAVVACGGAHVHRQTTLRDKESLQRQR